MGPKGKTDPIVRCRFFCGWLLALFFFGCQQNPLSQGLPEDLGVCAVCHGSDRSSAPPQSVLGASDRSDIGVGAHQPHLRISRVANSVACEECHTVPQTVEAVGHIDDSPAEVQFGTLAKTKNLQPSWDRNSRKCSNVYCHGASLSGGKEIEPWWTKADDLPLGCDSCHGHPPLLPHPQEENCHACHPDTVKSDQTIDLQAGTHIDGKLDVQNCNSCHGNEQNPAPPLSLSGSNDTKDIAVGAHQSHLQGGVVAQAIECEQCHLVPESVESAGHLDESPAEIVFGKLAKTDALDPVWDRKNQQCQNTYCHGASQKGGVHKSPLWTQVDRSQLTCESCHGNPPGPPHPWLFDCMQCHKDTLIDNTHIQVSSGLHIDGKPDFLNTPCNGCHGDQDSPAPPKDTLGNTQTSVRGVGAHRKHLGTSNWHLEVLCVECHLVPAELLDHGHADSALPAELIFGPLAKNDLANPEYNFEKLSCSGVYCHGATLSGTGKQRSPNWIAQDVGSVDCENCHTLPPESTNHPKNSNCVVCHECVVDADNHIRVDYSKLHINGRVNLEKLNACPFE